MGAVEVSVIGAGLMGGAIVERLLKSGLRVCVYNRTVEKIKELVKGGAEAIEVIDKAWRLQELSATRLLN